MPLPPLDLLPLLIATYNQMRDAGLQILRTFLVIPPATLKSYVEESFGLFNKVVKEKETNFKFFSSVFRCYLNRTENIKFPIEGAVERAISENRRQAGAMGPLFEKLLSQGESLRDLPKNKSDFNTTFAEGQNIFTESLKVGEQLNQLPQEEQDHFKHLVEEQRKDPAHLEADADRLVQKIKRTYESFRYILGFYVALFDFMSGCPQANVEGHYFMRHGSPYSKFYYYSQSTKANPKSFRHKLPSLKEYLNDTAQPFPGLKAIFNWVFGNKKAHFFRNIESHHLDDVRQDRIKEGYYAFLEGDQVKYKKVETLYKIQEDLYQLFALVKWMGMFYSSSIMLRLGFPS